MIGYRWTEDVSRLQKHVVADARKTVLATGPILADKPRLVRWLPSIGHEIVYSAEAALNATTTDNCGARNGTSHP